VSIPLQDCTQGYPADVAEYWKGDSAAQEMRQIREAFARAGAAMVAWPDVLQSFHDATELAELGQQITEEASNFRAWFAALLVDERGMTQAQLAGILDISPGRVGQLVRDGRKWKDSPMTDPATLPEQPHLALAIITDPARGVLIEHRRDNIPPWTFPAGEVQPGETTAAETLVRRVPEETGIQVEPKAMLGRRIHPRTGRVMVYVACTAKDQTTAPRAQDPDIDEAEWASLDQAKERMPDMFPVVREHLEAVLGGSVRM
jgi:8-oxo-dGTP diphosphatase